METKGKEDITSSMKPYMDEYATVSSNLIPRMNTLDKEFTSLIEGLNCVNFSNRYGIIGKTSTH